MKTRLLTLFLLAVTGAALACDTPVYRYAMYRWRPSPYEIYYFHRDAIPDADRKLQDQLTSVGEHDERPANLFVRAIDLEKDAELKSVPPDVRKWWQSREDRPTPSYLVVTPQGDEIHAGAFAESESNGLLESPLRKRIAKELESGHACVMLLLSGMKADDDGKPTAEEDVAATDKAEQELKSLVNDVNNGKVKLEDASLERRRTEDSPEVKPSIAYLRISRKDAAEQWLVKMLLSVERDLPELAEPMVFSVFGRGRALPPFVGKGITRDGLLDCVHFVTGACSCTVKEQNPGLDLLVRYDWEDAAKKVAAKFGAEEGNERFTASDVFADLAIPAKTVAESSPAATEPDEPKADEPAAASDDPPSEPVTPAPKSDLKTRTKAQRPASAARFAWADSALVVGTGIAVGFVLLFVATFFALRPR